MTEIEGLHGTEILRGGQADVARFRERARLRRIRRLNLVLWGVAAWMAMRAITEQSLLPHLTISPQLAPSFIIVGLLMFVLLVPMWPRDVRRTCSTAPTTSRPGSTTSSVVRSCAKRSCAR